MATKMENLEIQIAHFKQFMKMIPGIENCCQQTVDHLLRLGIIEVSTAFEQALAKAQETEVVSEDTHDLANGDDGKLATVRTYGYGKCYGAPVTNIKGKTGNLLVQVYERKQNKFYYFKIPHNAYKHIPSSSNIEIPFEMDGTPRRKNRAVVNFWKYEVDTLL